VQLPWQTHGEPNVRNHCSETKRPMMLVDHRRTRHFTAQSMSQLLARIPGPPGNGNDGGRAC
jgi:hypothetical protein